MARLLLASASPARAQTLRSAGIDFAVRVSDVDESALLAAGGHKAPALQVAVLARAKAEAVAALEAANGHLVLGCDSMFEIGGRLLGKPADAAEARERIAQLSGASGVLHTGHHLIDRRTAGPADARAASATASTTVHVGRLTEAEIDAYVATGEPLHVAGSFTIDGFGGPFIDGVEGDHHNVVGLSLPTLRRLLAEFGVSVADLWRRGG